MKEKNKKRQSFKDSLEYILTNREKLMSKALKRDVKLYEIMSSGNIRKLQELEKEFKETPEGKKEEELFQELDRKLERQEKELDEFMLKL